jgi:hypothetical protein
MPLQPGVGVRRAQLAENERRGGGGGRNRGGARVEGQGRSHGLD